MAENLLPTVPLGDGHITRLIIGGNPFSGNSHVSEEMDGAMEDFFTTHRIKQTLYRCGECGINTAQMRGDKHILRILRELRLEGLKMHWIAQTASEMLSLEGNVRQIMAYEPLAIYHHGTVTDRLYQQGDVQTLRANLEVLRRTGKPVGLGTHIPEVIERAEAEGWGVDFYMACVYNLSKQERVSSAVTGRSNQGEPFDEEDIPRMYDRIRKTAKPCLAFKILGATRRCATPQAVEACFREAYANIKPTDAVVVGMYPLARDQVAENAAYARRWAGEASL